MDLSRVILGPIVTEKAESQKTGDTRVYTLKVATKATKIDVKKAIKRFYDLDVASIRSMRVPKKTRKIRGGTMEKRQHIKKVFITLNSKKDLDLTSL